MWPPVPAGGCHGPRARRGPAAPVRRYDRAGGSRCLDRTDPITPADPGSPPAAGRLALAAAVLAAACGSNSPTPPATRHARALDPVARQWPRPAHCSPPVAFPLAVVARYDDLRPGVTSTSCVRPPSAGEPADPVRGRLPDARRRRPWIPRSGTRCLPAAEIPAAILDSGSAGRAACRRGPGAAAAGPGRARSSRSCRSATPICSARRSTAPLPYPLQAVAAPGIPGAAYDVATSGPSSRPATRAPTAVSATWP